MNIKEAVNKAFVGKRVKDLPNHPREMAYNPSTPLISGTIKHVHYGWEGEENVINIYLTNGEGVYLPEDYDFKFEDNK